MNNKLLLFLIIIFITIFIISIFIFIIYNKNKHIEKFETNNIFKTYMNYPRILLPNSTDKYSSTVVFFNDISRISSRTINLSEKYDITAASSLDNLGINGYGTYYINSSFYNINEPSPTNCISSLFNNRNLVTLKSPSEGNFDNSISILYPERFQFKGIEITLNSNANILANMITLYAFFSSTASKIKTIESFNENTISISIENINDIVIFYNTLYIIFDKNVNILEIINIKIFGQPLNTTITIIQNTASALDSGNINIFSENEYETLPNINTDIQYNINNVDNNNIYQERSIIDKFNLLLANNKTPWAMYTARNASETTLNDVFNRGCKKAIIEGGKYDIITENIGLNNANITYIKGTTAHTITFPIGSLPENYTICIMSKYTNNEYDNRRSRILTTEEPRNWLLGHWGNRSEPCMYNDDFIINYDPIIDTTKNTNWRISCAKSSANDPTYSVIIDNINKSSQNARINSDSQARLKINGWAGEKSDFGLAYLIIWDVVLTDSELLLVSQALTNYSKTGQELIINNNFENESTYGRNRNNPGFSAYDIKVKTCTNENGEYWIKNPSTGDVNKVYCIMDKDCHGGGWMLAMKATNKSTLFGYYSEYWTTDKTINKELSFDTYIDAKYDIFNYFKVSECLAIFDSIDTGGIVNKPGYGWTWYEPRFYNRNISLKDFFANSKTQFIYYSSGDFDIAAHFSSDRAYITKYDQNSFNAYIINEKYNNRIWSRQEHFQAFGFNIRPFGHEHKVRWGGTFNENVGGAPYSNDVSGGIGLSAYSGWSAGNLPTCCESHPGVPVKTMGFKWFIR